MQLNQTQLEALTLLKAGIAQGRGLLSLCGPAGTGKTTVIKALSDSTPVWVVTPTNKAAQVLRSKGVEASTLYAAFFVKEDLPDGKFHFVPCCDWQGPMPEGKEKYVGVIVVDEASMVSTWLVNKLRQMCDTLVLVGDGSQLPPVSDNRNPRGYFNTLKHTAELTEVMRQAGDSPVLELATEIRSCKNVMRLASLNGDQFYPESDFPQLFESRRPQMICFTNNTRRSLNTRARKVYGRTDVLPAAGDLMVCRNNYSEDLLNGTQCEIVQFSWNGKGRLANATVRSKVTGETTGVEMDMLPFLRDQPALLARDYLECLRGVAEMEGGLFMTYGYAITAHTSQGGEWDEVVVIDERHVCAAVAAREAETRENAMPPEDYARRWVYTAVTRAKNRVYLADQQWTKY